MSVPAASIALNRFGLGARPGDRVQGDPRRWLTDQVARYDPRPAPIAAAPGSAGVSADLAQFYAQLRDLKRAPPTAVPSVVTPPPVTAPSGPAAMAATLAAAPAESPEQLLRHVAQQRMQATYEALVGARVAAALTTDTPFTERLAHFWSNHFAVSTDKLELTGLAGTLENEAIRPHLTGRFADMLFAVERHPAMLLYLDQSVSVGPDSPYNAAIVARGRRAPLGLNENLARETLELHTLGVRTGYTQSDVTEYARALTGWTVAGVGRGAGARLTRDDGPPGAFSFAPELHEPGDRTIIGKRYPAGGEEQAGAVLTDLAVHPATATHLATKLSRHFAGDAPPQAMVARLKDAFLRSGGDLPTVYRAIVASPEAWAPAPVKFRPPWEWCVAALRATGAPPIEAKPISGLLAGLGQPTWRPGQPSGWDDIAGSWASPDALRKRVDAAGRLTPRSAARIDARSLAPQLFPDSLSPATSQALARADSAGQALALLLVSPEMLRR